MYRGEGKGIMSIYHAFDQNNLFDASFKYTDRGSLCFTHRTPTKQCIRL